MLMLSVLKLVGRVLLIMAVGEPVLACNCQIGTLKNLPEETFKAKTSAREARSNLISERARRSVGERNVSSDGGDALTRDNGKTPCNAQRQGLQNLAHQHPSARAAVHNVCQELHATRFFTLASKPLRPM